ncbi:MAG: sulfatase [Bacteroidales bacterium]|nr:sulfatase [Bacteroidales bacterium]MCF8389559.1 sulfatase [Bacteroidales bacterium]
MIKKLLTILIICLAKFNCAFTQSKPNIILIVSDDHGKDALGCYGNSVIKTPAIDDLGSDGMRFTNAFCTSASCSASRSVLLTGKFNHATGHYGHEHSYNHFSTFDTEKSLPYYLEKAGYRTARVGKYHLAPESVYHFQQVFSADLRNPVQMANVCEEFISADSIPFFLYYCTGDPHRAWAFDNLPLRPNSFGNLENDHYPGVIEQYYKPEEVIVPPFLPDTDECRAELAQYYQSVSRVDQGVGRLIEILNDAGLYDNTVIIYISDNGIAFPGAKTTLYEPGMSLPCIVKLAGQKDAAEVRENMFSWVDMTPTLLDLAGIFPLENTFHGRSLRGELLDPLAAGANEVYASHTFHEITMYYPMRVIREKRYKFIYNIAYQLDYPSASDLWDSNTWQSVYTKGEKSLFGKRTVEAFLHRPKFELYDLENDPDEIYNLAEKKKFQPMVLEFTEKMKAFQERTNDPWLLKWEHE